MPSDKERRNTAYRKENTKQICMRFYPADMELYDYLQTKENRMAYIKNLLREDMERKNHYEFYPEFDQPYYVNGEKLVSFKDTSESDFLEDAISYLACDGNFIDRVICLIECERAMGREPSIEEVSKAAEAWHVMDIMDYVQERNGDA